MKIFKLLFLALIISSGVIAQSFTVPTNYQFKTTADYEKYENQIVECCDWLLSTPMSQNKAKREKAMKFLGAYSIDNPKVIPYLNSKAFPFLKNGNLSMVYIASWTRSCLSQNYVNNKEEFTLRATNDVLSYYTTNKKGIGKVKKITKFLDMKKSNTLETYVKSKL